MTFDRLKDPDALYLGRAHPAVEETCHVVLGKALGVNPRHTSLAPERSFTSDGMNGVPRLFSCASVTSSVRLSKNSREEIVLAAFEQHGSAIRWLTPLADRAAKLLDAKSGLRASTCRLPSVPAMSDGPWNSLIKSRRI